jgi:predicted nuclease of predicted toxin-antitoxin system
VNILFDHNLSPRLARALDALLSDNHTIVALRDKFPTDISDIDFISALSREGNWIIISGDYRITRNKAERQAFQQSRLTGFLGSMYLTYRS